MPETVESYWDDFFAHHPALTPCRNTVVAAYTRLVETLSAGGTLFVCGNGGSASDADHIVGELMKRFRLERPMSDTLTRLFSRLPEETRTVLEGKLEVPFRAMALGRQTALASAFSNDVDPSLEFAQELLGYGQPSDALLALSTSGNSRNVVLAAELAGAMGLYTIGLTGRNGGQLAGVCETVIRVPAEDTAAVQEYHLPIYHALCAAVELDYVTRRSDWR